MKLLRLWAMASLTLAAGLALCAPIKFWAVTGSVLDVQMYKTLAQEFQKETGIEVEVTPLAWGNFKTKYFTAMAAGLPPDIGVTNLGGPFDYGAVGGLVDLRAEFPEESKSLEAQFDPKLLTMFTIGDKLYGVPCDLSTLALYYRTDVFERLGLKAPATWSELNQVIGKLEANHYQYYFGFTAGAQWALSLYTLPYGLPGFEKLPDGKVRVNWNDPKYQKGVMQALRLWHMHNSPGRDMGSRVIGMFQSTKPGEGAPLILEVHNSFSGIQQDAPGIDGKWTIAPWPKADDGESYNIMGGTTYVIFRRSQHKREALKWMQFLLSDRSQQEMTRLRMKRSTDLGIAIPSTKSMFSAKADEFWREPLFGKIQPLVKVLKEVVPTFSTTAAIQGSPDAGRLEANMLDQMGTWIRDELDRTAREKGISRTALVESFGAGKNDALKEQLESKTAAKLKAEYEKIAPEALAILQKEEARYDSKYGNIIDRLPDLERQISILDWIKLAGLLVLIGGGVAIAAVPKLRSHAISYVFVAPPLVLALIFVFIPAVVAAILSFTDYHPVLPLSTATWTGVDNYKTVATSGDLGTSMGRTLKYALVTLPVGIVLSLLFAYLLNYRLAGQKFWRFLYFSPLVTSVVSVALIFTQLFMGGPQGWLNALMMPASRGAQAVLNLVGLGGVQIEIKDPIPFLTSEHTFLNCIIALAIWQGLAFTILVFLAGLQQIPNQLYEAAEIDGATEGQRFRHVALPGLRPQIFFVTVLGLIGSFQVFEVIFTLANKSGDAGARFGPNDSALTMVPLIYHTAFETYEMGKSAAIAYILFAVILLLTLIQTVVYRKGGSAA